MMRITKSRDDERGGWYYADPRGRRVSPTYEHEGMLDNWARHHGAFNTFVVYSQNLEGGGEESLGNYNDYETADRRRVMEKKSNQSQTVFVSVREETWIPLDEPEPDSEPA
jgi:hypothetical protein